MLLKRGKIVTDLDRDISQIVDLSEISKLKIVKHGLEGAAAWTFGPQVFGRSVIVYYLFRQLSPMIMGSLTSNGVRIYQTFALETKNTATPATQNFFLRRMNY